MIIPRLVRIGSNPAVCVPRRRFAGVATGANDFLAVKLNRQGHKSLLRITGSDSFIYLQSVLSNDMRKLLPETPESSGPAIYAYLLSAVGRVLCDLFVYRGRTSTEFLLEVDTKLARPVQRLLMGYDVKRSVQVEIASDFDLWTVIPVLPDEDRPIRMPLLDPMDSDDIKLVPDPRIGPCHLGYRFLTRLGGATMDEIAPYLSEIRMAEGRLADYVRLRYRLGVSETHHDHGSGMYSPFELNGDFLNAISLNKGLYTAEERMVKTCGRDTGRIKRRLFPVRFVGGGGGRQSIRELAPAPRTLITNGRRGPVMGELTNRLGSYGLASLLVSPMLSGGDLPPRFLPGDQIATPLIHADTGLRLKAAIPRWWPHNYDQIQLHPPGDYPRNLFNFQSRTKNVHHQTLK